MCCSYVTVEIDGPDDLDSATQILWHLYHEGVSIYVDDDEWLVQFETRCQHLRDDFKCGIYEQRPPICRNFDERSCEINAAEVGVTFYTAAEYLSYLALHHKRVHGLIAKRYLPKAEALGGRPQSRKRLPLARRFEELRGLGAPES
jgi:Fe-S-cluster containining protein